MADDGRVNFTYPVRSTISTSWDETRDREVPAGAGEVRRDFGESSRAEKASSRFRLGKDRDAGLSQLSFDMVGLRGVVTVAS